jgi:hypothetical protein
MGILSKPLWAVLGVLTLGLAISVSAALYYRGDAKVQASEKNRAQADLKGLEKAYLALEADSARRAEVDAAQSDNRAEQAKAVRAVRAKVLENKNENDSRYHADRADLDRMRRLTEAANASIRAAR